MRSWLSTILVLLLLAACESGGESAGEGSTGESADEQGSDDNESAAPSGETEAGTRPSEQAEPFEGLRNGRFESERFNVRFSLPGDWELASSQTSDSLSFVGPGGIQMLLANSESIQLVDGNFEQLNDRVSFDAVNVLPDRTQAGPVNGLPGYRVEGDALLRGDNVPIYFISQAVNVPGQPVMVTIFIPGDNYFEHSDTMHAVLDSIEALDLRPTD